MLLLLLFRRQHRHLVIIQGAPIIQTQKIQIQRKVIQYLWTAISVSSISTHNPYLLHPLWLPFPLSPPFPSCLPPSLKDASEVAFQPHPSDIIKLLHEARAEMDKVNDTVNTNTSSIIDDYSRNTGCVAKAAMSSKDCIIGCTDNVAAASPGLIPNINYHGVYVASGAT